MVAPSSNLRDRDVIIYDDISASGKTIEKIYKLAKKSEPKRIFIAVAHILTKGGVRKLKNLGAHEIITTNSLSSDFSKDYTELSLTPLLTGYIRAG